MKLTDSDLDSYGFLQADGCTYEKDGVRTWVPARDAVIQIRDDEPVTYVDIVTVHAIQHFAGQNEVLFILEDERVKMFNRETEVEVRVYSSYEVH